MPAAASLPSANPAWRLHRDPRGRPFEWLAERLIFLVSLSAILLVSLIFVFVAREALPVLLGRTDSSRPARTLPLAEMSRLSDEELRRHLGLAPAQFAAMDAATRRLLMEVKLEIAAETPPTADASRNTTDWRHLLLPQQWEGYVQPAAIWQPVSDVPKFNLLPLFVGSLKVTLVALVLSVPLALGAALYVSQLASQSVRLWLKPAIELLAGVPSVVLGFIALMVLASLFQSVFGYASRFNAFVAGTALALAVIPVVFTVAEQALSNVPRGCSHAALALGATRWQAAWQAVLPTALPGVLAAIALGFSRALGETMIVLMVSGNASILSWNVFDSSRTMTATMAAEMAETVFGGAHYRILFLLGLCLFAVTFITNLIADVVLHRLKARLQAQP
jgi:phosphate transport system permease protein